MSWVDDAVAAFGRDMGMAGLRLPADGAVELAFERRGTLALERSGGDGDGRVGDDLLVYLTRARPHGGPERLAKALALCHWRHDRAPPVQAGAKDDHLVLLLRLKAREVTPEAIAQGFDRLVRLMDELEQA